MSIANNIREAVVYSRLKRLQDSGTVENAVLTAFMRKGEYFTTTAHAMDFALLVAEALDADHERHDRAEQLLRMVQRARAYIGEQRAMLWRSHVNPRSGKVEDDGADAIAECDVLLLGLEVGSRRLQEAM